MLSYALAIAVAISSLVLFSTAFLMSKIHRRDDFLWRGVGVFYALVLWYCAKNITGAVLLGQTAATALLVSYGWQTIKLRQMIANPGKAVATSSFSLVNTAKGLWKGKKQTKEVPATPEAKAPMPTVTEQEIAIPKTPVEMPQQTPEPINAASDSDDTISDSTTSESTPDEPAQDQIEENTNNAPAIDTPSAAPLPNKLPESVDSPVTELTVAEPSVNKIDTPPPDTADSDNTSNDKIDVSPAPVVPIETETETKIDNIPEATAKVAPAPDISPYPATPTSPLDSLETVEVAEVLEAETDNNSDFSESNQANIIEVTTTDIDVDTETKK